MTRFNQFLILLALLILASCARLAFADICELKPISDLHKLSNFLQRNEAHPEFMYHFNGVSVTKERYEELMLEKRDKKRDPNLRMP